MNFEKKVPDWENVGAEPDSELKKGGFKAGYKPPAAYFNWFFNRISESVKELQNSLRALAFKDTVSDADITDVAAGKVKQDSTHRMITDTERTNWNDANAKKHTHSNKTVLDKVTQALLDNWSAAFTHVSDAVKHITSAERTKWNAVTDKVDKVSGKQLSTNDYTTAEKNKLAGIAAGAEVNVQPDWNQTDVIANDYIKNRPVSFPPSGHTHDDRYYTETEMNTKLGAKVTASGGDVSDTKVGSITASTASYPVPAAGDTVKVGFGKITKFFGGVKNWMTGVCLIGSIVNNCVTNNAKLPLSAAQGKVLMDLYTVLNTKLNGISMRSFSQTPHLSVESDRFTIMLPSDIKNAQVRCILACNRNLITDEAYVISCKQISDGGWQAIGNKADKWFISIQFIAFFIP